MSYIVLGAVDLQCPHDTHFEFEGSCKAKPGPEECPTGFFWDQSAITCRPTSSDQCEKWFFDSVKHECVELCPPPLLPNAARTCVCPDQLPPDETGNCPSRSALPPDQKEAPASATMVLSPTSALVFGGAVALGAIWLLRS